MPKNRFAQNKDTNTQCISGGAGCAKSKIIDKTVPNNGTKTKTVPNNGMETKTVPNNGTETKTVPDNETKIENCTQ